MNCPTCDHTMSNISESQGPIFWCLRCGTIYNNGSEEPSLVGIANELADHLEENAIYNVKKLVASVKEATEIQ